ncbi:MAG: tetratricopeptide repeat protein, partial [Pseudomonadota bacterium]
AGCAPRASRPPCSRRWRRARVALGDRADALALLKGALARYPHSRPVLYAALGLLQDMGRNDEALAMLTEPLRLYPRDARLHAARARAYAGLGKRLLQHQAQAEVYVLQGSLPAAIEQLQLAQGAGDGNFYELSAVEARLKELRNEHAREVQEAKKR